MQALENIPIENAGFEEPALEDGGFTELEDIPGWEAYDPNGLIPETPSEDLLFSDVGAFNPFAAQYPQEAPEGENVGYAFAVNPVGSGELGLFQTLDTPLAANTQYMLEVEVGNLTGIDQLGSDFAGFPGYRVELLAGDTVLASEQNNLYIEEGTFETSEVTFTATPDSPYLGQNLGIRLVNVLQEPGLEVDFDNVSLTAQALPDTSTTMM